MHKERFFQFEALLPVRRPKRQRMIAFVLSGVLMILPCLWSCASDDQTYDGPSLSDIEDNVLLAAQVDVPYGERCLFEGRLQSLPLATYDGSRRKVNATARRITLTGLRDPGWFSCGTPFTEDIPYQSIIACRKTGLMGVYLNTIQILDGNHCLHFLKFDADIDISRSGVKLPTTALLDKIRPYVSFVYCSFYSQEWAFNRFHPMCISDQFKNLPIGFYVSKSKIPFGGYVGHVLNFLSSEITVTAKVDDCDYTEIVKSGKEMSFGLVELKRKLRDGDVIYIRTSESTSTSMKILLAEDSAFTCTCYYY